MFKKRLILLSGFVLIAASLSACGGGSNGSAGGDSTSKGLDKKETENPVSNEPAELIFYSNSTDSVESFDQRFGNPIRKKFSNYTIKYIQKTKDIGLNDLITTSAPIDIYWESVGQYMDGIIQYDMQYDMTDLIKKHNVDLSRFESTTIDAIKAISGGKLYGLPVTNLTMSLFYNKDLFDKFGVPYLKDGMTWDQVTDVSGKLTRKDGDKQYIGLGISQAHWLRLNPFSLPFVDPATNKPTINTNDKWKVLFEIGFIKPAQFAGFRDEITNAKNSFPAAKAFDIDKESAMYAFLNSYYFTTDTTGFNWEMVSFPTFKEAPGIGPQLYPLYFSVTKTSKFKDQAMEVIKYLTSDEFQMELSKQGTMPVLKSPEIQKVFGQSTTFKDKNLKSVFYNKFAPISAKTIYDAAAEKAYRTNIVNLAMGTIDINTAFRKAEEDTNKAISDMKAK